MSSKSSKPALPDLDLGLLNVNNNDTIAQKLFMLIEGVYGLGVKHSIGKYGYSEQRYYQLLKKFQLSGSSGLIDKKRGPQQNSRRAEKMIQQIIRQRFLDPDASAAVIFQKLKQTHFSISLRSVERTIQEYGLQKKLYQLNPDSQAKAVVIQQTKREKRKASVTMQSNEIPLKKPLITLPTMMSMNTNTIPK